MKTRIVLTILTLLILYSCNNSKRTELLKTLDSSIYSGLRRDTIIEHNTPDSLNLKYPQRFIDTTRNSIFFKKFTDWQPSDIDSNLIEQYTNRLKNLVPKSTINLGTFPRHWISLHKLNGELMTYDPINGIDYRFIITDQYLLHFSIEAEADAISKVISISDTMLLLELKTIPQKNPDQQMYMRIKKSRIPDVYTLQYSSKPVFEEMEFVELITPLENASKFNMLVDHSEILLVENIPFEKIKSDEVE
jgi:hypothetical protein